MIRKWLMVLVLLWPALGQAQAAKIAPVVLVMGDSLGAAYGVPVQQGWVALLQQRLHKEGYPHRTVNASISGETSAGGLARLPAALKLHAPKIVLIELGANDAFRGLKIERLRENLASMIRLSRKAGAQPLLFEMRVPENYGADYTRRFAASYAELSRQTKTPQVPFFLMPLVADPLRWFLEDGIHPSAAAQPLLLDAVWPSLKPLLGHKPG